MTEAYICDAVRTPIGRYGGALAAVRADDLAAVPIRALIDRNAGVDWEAVDDLIYGCANQAGEDNRNVARMAVLLSGLPTSVLGGHGQSVVWLRYAGRRRRGSGRPSGRGGVDDCRRRREHVPCALRHAQS